MTFSLAQLFIVISCARSGGLVPPGVVLVPVDDVLDELDGDEVEDESVGEHQLVGRQDDGLPCVLAHLFCRGVVWANNRCY